MTPHPYKVALVTGASKRIGKYIAKTLAAKGLKTIVHYHQSAEDAETVVAAIKAQGGRATALEADLANPLEAQNLFEQATQAFDEPVDVLINNASLFEKDSLQTLTPESWTAHQNINQLAPLLLTQALARELPTGRKGLVINMVDQRVLKLNPLYMSYTASKAGLSALTKTTAQALAPQQIRVNAIAPGPTLANEHDGEAGLQHEQASVPLGYGPTLEEFAQAITFLLETPSVTGQMIALDGGQHLAWRTPDIVED